MNDTQYDNRLFSELYDVQPQAIIWLKPIWSEDGTTITDFEFSYCNEEGLRYLNLTREQQRGLRVSVSPTMTGKLRKAFMEEMIGVYKTGEKSETDIYNPALNKYARVLRTKLRGGILTIVQDRTEEHRTIKRLKEQKQQLQQQKRLLDNLLKYSPAGLSVTEVIRDEAGAVVDGRTILGNDLAFKLTGVSKEEALSKTIREVDPAMLDSPLYQKALNALSAGEPLHTQYYFEPTQRWLELSVASMDSDHLINVFTDVTSAKQAQLRFEQAAERLRAVFNSSQSGMITFAPVWNEQGEIADFRFVIANPAFSAYVNKTPEALRGTLASDYFPGYFHNGIFDMYKKTYLTGETLRDDIHYQVDALDLYLNLLSTKVDDEVLVTFTDHTTLKKTQFRLEKLIEDLKRSNAYLEEFAHAASHDLKEPIRKVRTFSDRLRASLGDRMNNKETDLFERMQNATDRMSILVDDLLSYSHVSAMPLQMEDVNLNEKLQLVLSDLEVQIEEKKAVINIGPLPTVKGYRRQLQQLFQNLVGNALKYSKTGEPPQIAITSRTVTGAEVPLDLPGEQAGKSYYLIEVADNGIGFEQQYARKIFGMFQRLHGRSEYAGTGVGLSIARKVVENHKGYIWAESKPGKGSSFKVLLPV